MSILLMARINNCFARLQSSVFFLSVPFVFNVPYIFLLSYFLLFSCGFSPLSLHMFSFDFSVSQRKQEVELTRSVNSFFILLSHKSRFAQIWTLIDDSQKL